MNQENEQKLKFAHLTDDSKWLIKGDAGDFEYKTHEELGEMLYNMTGGMLGCEIRTFEWSGDGKAVFLTCEDSGDGKDSNKLH